MKIGLLQCNLVSNDIERNVETLYQGVRKAAAAGVDLCVGSELALCGCPATEQLSRAAFIDYCRVKLQELAVRLQDDNLPPLLVGAPIANPVPEGKSLHNCAVFLRSGKIMVIARKVLLSADGTHDDFYYFEPGVACGVLQYDGWRFAVTVGEDVWNDRGFWHGRRQFNADPVEEFMNGGADALINITGVAYAAGGIELHKKVLSWSACKYRTPLVCVNQIGGMDSAVYPGGSMVFNACGALVEQAALFREDMLVVDMDRLKGCDSDQGDCKPMEEEEEIWNALVLGVRDFTGKCGFVSKDGMATAVLGLSGGIDSALVASIAAEAMGPENVLGVLMPSPHSSSGSVDDSLQLAKNLGIKTVTVPIEPAMNAFSGMFAPSFAGTKPDTTEENLQARIRGVTLMAFSNKFGHILLNTGNKSEAAVGYSTLYGDSCGALGVISDLYKVQVYALSEWINKRRGFDVIPRAIIEKAPSAELRPDQKDSDSLPDYPVLDAMLRAYLEDRCGRNELVERGFDAQMVEKVLRMLHRAEFKRRQSPPGLHISSHAFGRGGRRLVAANFT